MAETVHEIQRWLRRGLETSIEQYVKRLITAAGPSQYRRAGGSGFSQKGSYLSKRYATERLAGHVPSSGVSLNAGIRSHLRCASMAHASTCYTEIPRQPSEWSQIAFLSPFALHRKFAFFLWTSQLCKNQSNNYFETEKQCSTNKQLVLKNDNLWRSE